VGGWGGGGAQQSQYYTFKEFLKKHAFFFHTEKLDVLQNFRIFNNFTQI